MQKTNIYMMHYYLESVVVKVRYPDVERLLRGDVRTIKMFAKLAQPVHVPALEEIEKQFMTEFDYRQEARQMARIRENLTKAGLAGPGKLCLVPKPYLEYCTTRVLVMEELKGDKLVVALKRDAQVQAQRAGLTIDELRASNKEKERNAKAKGEQLQGPTAKEYDMYISVLDGKRRLENAGRMTHNVLLGWLPGFDWKAYEDLSTLPINHAKMVDDLLYIHGHEVISCKIFYCDAFDLWLTLFCLSIRRF
jgi:aarF domain-containing kinase